MSLTRFDHHINGADLRAAEGQYLPSYNPTTAEPWAEVALGTEADVDAAVSAAQRAFISWRRVGPSARAELLWRLGDALAEHAEDLAVLESRDTGKVIREMRGQITGLRRWYQYYASLAHHLDGRAIVHDDPTILNYTRRDPFGVIGIIPAFNSPVLLTSYSMGPALAVGNTVVIKPPEVASSSIVRFAQLATEVGFPPGVINVVTGTGQQAGDALVAHPGVRKLFFTGGVATGRAVARRASEAPKSAVLELGGKSANIVFADLADLDATVNGIVAGIFAAAGQTCVAGSRLLVHDAIADDLVTAVAARAAAIRIGDPTDTATEMGPLSQESILDGVETGVARAIGDGAQLIAGGTRPPASALQAGSQGSGRGWFYAPTVLDHVENSMHVAQTELFGPVLSVIRFTEDDQAVAIANDSPFGLAAGLWTTDLNRAHRVAEALDASTVWVNTYRAMSYRSPFGGRGESGYGRENGIEVLDEVTQSKSIWIDTSGRPMGDPFVLR